jgi:hypothetical protein
MGEQVSAQGNAAQGYIAETKDASELVSNLLNFFGASSVDAWENYWLARVMAARFKNSGRPRYDPFAVAAWLGRNSR